MQSDNGITPAEAKVLAALVGGCTSTQQLADRLHISQKTVNTHLTNLFRRLDVPNRTALAVKALKDQWQQEEATNDHDQPANN